ncbi:hypothetical protein [Antarcticirhabdus aurantiaca]|uniref:Uncharacterized protein n=1 Tax=Antarcticirhabdus aurantiaca TaxID=2606717 RepID=A0ACD4NPQ6_9HYPH|nr:hypothetical protein [Antarcticirhabdus aurantiaca]WAJ28744.1 hypothetical protein OXU80_00365 [Jeongeuplla avenae]
MSEASKTPAKTGQGDPILPVPVGEDGIVQPERGGEAEAPRPSGDTDKDAHDLAHGNDLKTP